MKNKKKFHAQVIDPLLSVIKHLSTENAFCISETFYTYKQLGEAISSIRAEIKKVDKEDKYIGLITNDDLETYASIIALWLEGKAYVPLHPHQPISRWEEIIDQMKLRSVLDSGKAFDGINCTIIKTYDLTYQESFLSYDDSIEDSESAYILFTSGSTGVPKGVIISRKNIGSFLDSFWDSGITLTKEDRCLQCFDLTFDVSIQSFLAPLTKGACVYTIPHDQIKYSYVYGLLEDQRITFGAMAPSMLRYLKPYFAEIDLPDLKCCILTGEASPLDLVDEWKNCIPNAEIFDFYGPTETTIYCTYYKFKRNGNNKVVNGMLSIGMPMKNVMAIIIDENDNILGAGEKGELCIAGDHVSVGYWNQIEKNKIAFFEKEINGIIYRFYHTGDLCYYDNEKYLMLHGRLDSQIKIQGYRVELGEIEFHAREYLRGNNSVIVTFTNSIGNTDLALFVEGELDANNNVLEYLKTKLPSYMIPGKLLIEKEFPLNTNGKVDKRILKEKISQIRESEKKA